MDCKQASQLISQTLDKKLSWRERLELRWHLYICDACRQFKQHMLVLRKALKRMLTNVENDESIRLPAATKARIAEKMNATKH